MLPAAAMGSRELTLSLANGRNDGPATVPVEFGGRLMLCRLEPKSIVCLSSGGCKGYALLSVVGVPATALVLLFFPADGVERVNSDGGGGDPTTGVSNGVNC